MRGIEGCQQYAARRSLLDYALQSITAGVVLFTLVALTGCASSEPVTVRYDNSADITTFETHPIEAGIDLSGGALGSGRRVLFQVRARCRGQGCTPEEAAMSFVLSGGSSPVYIADRSVRIRADGERYRWMQQSRREIDESAPVVGQIVEVMLDLDALETIAGAKTVTGTLGSKAFEWSYALRAPLRALVSQMKG